MKLEGLTVGQSDTAVQGTVGSETIDPQPLLRGNHAAWQTAAQHHGMTRFEFLFSALGANIAVILLIHAVKADQQEVIAVKATGQAIMQIGGNAATQEITVALHALGIAQRPIDHQRARMLAAKLIVTHQYTSR